MGSDCIIPDHCLSFYFSVKKVHLLRDETYLYCSLFV